MSYLIAQDYLMQIQAPMRAQINSLAMARAELTAMEEINGYLQTRYDTSAEFTDTMLYNTGAIYKAYNRVYINYPAYVPGNNYATGNYVVYGNSAYACTGATTGTFDLTKWAVIGPATMIYYAAYPAPLFNIYGCYKVGDAVFWKDHTYTCKVASQGVSPFQAQQYSSEGSVPLSNVFPNDPVNGAADWTDNGAYSVPANTLNSAAYDDTAIYPVGDTVTYTDNQVYQCTTAITVAEAFNPAHWRLLWAAGDNRSQLVMTHMINIALYWALYSIAPNNVPADRHDAYEIATEWCRAVRDGVNTTPLPVVQPKHGQRILFDSQVKRQNNY